MTHRTVCAYVCALVFPFSIPTAALAAEKLEGGSPDIIAAFLNSDKTWYQDAMVAYHGKDRKGADGVTSKIGFTLTLLKYQWDNHQARNPGKKFQCFDSAIPISGNKTQVEVVIAEPKFREGVTAALKAAGARKIAWEGVLASCWLPNTALTTLAGTRGLKSMRPGYRTNHVGLTTSQGDRALRADLARSATPPTAGEGITIGTLSDSFASAANPATTAAQDVQNGDLPQGIVVLDELDGAGTDEGRAMMQIIADLAPQSAQQFHTAFDGQAGFAQGIRDLADSGCDVIVDDVFFFAEPFFQNGLIARAVNDVVTQQNVVYFSAAGNSGTNSYESAFSPSSAVGISQGELHDFDPGAGEDPFMRIRVPVGETVTFVFQWDEPFFSVSGAPGSASDMDIMLTALNAGQPRVLAGGLASNVGGDALEIFSFENDGSIDEDGVAGPDEEFNLAIERFSGPAPGLMKFLFFDAGGVLIQEFATNSSTCVGHSNTQNAIGVAAVPFFNTPRFGVSPARVEDFSSLGGAPILFGEDGARLATPLLTSQPRLACVDGANTTFFGQDISSAFPDEADTFPNFFGTSAAAPHAAAVAALMLSKAGGPGSLTPTQVETLLKETAVAVEGSPLFSGAGLINAEAVLKRIAPPDLPPTLRVTARTRSGDRREILKVEGRAKDDVQVATVRFRVNGGSFQTATGKTRWSFEARLRAGENKVVIEVKDSAGQRTRKTLQVTR